MARGSVIFFVAGVALFAGACAYFDDRPTPVTRLPDGEERLALSGTELYQRDCAWCHASDGSGTFRGPNLDGELDGGAYTHFMLSTGRMPIDTPDEETDRKTPVYDDEEMAAVVEYVVSLGGTGPAIPDVDPDAGDLAVGEELYAENCAACHSTTGAGGALTSGETAPAVMDATPVQIAEAMLVGPGCPNDDPDCGPGDGAMPIFDDFTNDEVNAVAAYIRVLQSGKDHGGLGLGRIGPVTEGAVALLIGLGVMVAFVRWIGTSVGDRR